MKRLLIVIMSIFLLGCSKKHHRTDSICEGKLYVEIYSDWSDMGECYLTDSVNFKVKLYRFNAESEYYKHYCNPDSLIIELWSNYPLPKHILKTKTFYFKKLIEEGELNK